MPEERHFFPTPCANGFPMENTNLFWLFLGFCPPDKGRTRLPV